MSSRSPAAILRFVGFGPQIGRPKVATGGSPPGRGSGDAAPEAAPPPSDEPRPSGEAASGAAPEAAPPRAAQGLALSRRLTVDCCSTRSESTE